LITKPVFAFIPKSCSSSISESLHLAPGFPQRD
jgi:hypothetical protein